MPTVKHGRICNEIAFALNLHVRDQDMGRIVTNDSFIRISDNPPTVRGADVAFYSFARLPRGPLPEGLLPALPDLVVEVRSPSQDWISVFQKVGEYLAAGVTLVLLLDAERLTASTYHALNGQTVFDRHAVLTLPDVLPGFSLLVARLFDDAP